ncbi:hypothetical protein K474DRAFT_172517 [Panus rudis PR-1116 ss-1]|nr:hypothetical protein K474DRAFT_172517 [Panus rudis PR-1116 ss-1]
MCRRDPNRERLRSLWLRGSPTSSFSSSLLGSPRVPLFLCLISPLVALRLSFLCTELRFLFLRKFLPGGPFPFNVICPTCCDFLWSLLLTEDAFPFFFFCLTRCPFLGSFVVGGRTSY